MKKLLIACIYILAVLPHLNAQTSWTGTTSTDWRTSSNWTGGVPTAVIDAIIGDANFTGSFQPVLTGPTATCKSLTIGTGSISSTLSIAKNLTVSGNITIGSNGTILQSTVNRTITLTGNWDNSGTYSATASGSTVTFSGSAQTITGTSTFQRLTVNTGSTITLASNIIVNDILSVSGTVEPTASFSISGTAAVNLNSGGTLRVKASTFSGNYALSGAYTINGKSTVNYSSSVIDQDVSNAFTYGYLRISGGTTKHLIASLPALNSSNSSAGRIYIDAGTFDLHSFTANRGTTVSGGSIVLAAGTTLKIGGTNTFPANFATITLASSSTVDYNGTNQTVIPTTYGNLSMSSSSGAVIKTMPSSAFTIAGNFTGTGGSGSITFTAANTITVNQSVSLDANTTFNGSSYTLNFKGNWINNGVFNGNTSTASFKGVNTTLSGSGTNNFYSLAFTAAGIAASGATAINVSGNLSSSGTGGFTHNSGGTLTMTGTSKTITGTGLKLYNTSITGSVTTPNSLSISGDLSVSGSFAASGGTIALKGISKTVSGSGTITFYALSITGSISTAVNITLLSNFSVAIGASYSASAGTTYFNGISTLSGTTNLFNVTLNATKTLTFGSNSVLGIAGALTKSGVWNVTNNVPNTVRYNSSGAQTVVSSSYNTLVLDGGGTKTAAGNVTVNNDFTINSGVTYGASSYTLSVYRHFTCNGNFTASTSTVQLLGSNAGNVTGAVTFNNLTVNKSSSSVWVTLLSSITTSTLTMTTGNILTKSNSVTITSTRSGSGIIIGTITHSHAFTSGTAYYFEGSQNSITFTSPSASLNSVTVTVIIDEIADFDPTMECITREYDVTIPAGTYTSATWRMHYLDNELNAFDEPYLSTYKFNSGVAWDSIGFNSRNTSSNYVEKTSVTSLAGRWTLSGIRNVVRWNGSVSSVWSNAANWTTISGSNMSNRVPTSTDAAQIGYGTFTYQPSITNNQTVNVLRYGSVQATNLTLSGGSLTVIGSVKGIWSASASHTLDVAAATLAVGTNFDLSGETTGHTIQLKIGGGSATIGNDLTQTEDADITFTGAGSLTLSGSYNYTSGTFNAGSGTIIYTGGESQLVAPLTYNNLSFTKTTERATINFPATVNGNFSTATGGEVVINDTLSVAGNITIGASTNLIEMSTVIQLGGNWTNNGTFTVGGGTVNFNGSVDQYVNANTFNNLKLEKTGGTLSSTGDLVIHGDLNIAAGTLNLSTYLADRSSPGGSVIMGPSTLLKVAGSNNFPNNFITDSLDLTSTVQYYGTIAQTILNLSYGNLTLSNGGSTAKSLAGDVTINGNLLINSGSTLSADSNRITLLGNFTNNGTLSSGTSTLLLEGTSKTFTGTTSVYNLYVTTGSYTIASGTLSIAGDLYVDATGSLNFGSNNVSLDGDLTNRGSLISNGTATFTGTRTQTLQLLNAITSASTGIVNFNGSVSPILNSTSSPTFATVNINNTGGISPSTPWTVFFACNIAAGATFNGGPLTHTFYGNFTNNGTVYSDGELKFLPSPPFSSSATIKLNGSAFTSTGKIEFGGTSPITITDNNPSVYNVYITNTHSSGVAFPDSWNVLHDLYIGPGATFKGGTGLNHTISGNLTDNGTLSGGTSTIIFNGNPAEINGSGSTVFNNLTIASAADIVLNKSIAVTGNLVVNDLFTTSGRTITFSGSSSSAISGTLTPITLDEVIQDKTSGSTVLSAPVTISGELTLTHGTINTTSTNILTLADNATSTTGSNDSYINGPMKKTGDDAFIFPVGKSSHLRPVAIAAPSQATDNFTAEYFYVDPHSSYSTLSKDISLHHISRCEYWMLDRTGGSSDVEVILSWDSTSCGVNSTSDLRIAQWNGSQWKDFGNGNVTGSAIAGTVSSSSAVNSYGPFTLASQNGNNALPVELSSFNVQRNGYAVDVKWSTASEKNSDYFVVEKSTDGRTFEKVDVVKANGYSLSLTYYSLRDNEPYKGISYYRLKSVDFNGDFEYSEIAKVKIDDNYLFAIAPNPTRDGNFSIKLSISAGDNITVRMYDVNGEQSFLRKYELPGSGSYTIDIYPETRLIPGIYQVVLQYEGQSFARKIIVE